MNGSEDYNGYRGYEYQDVCENVSECKLFNSSYQAQRCCHNKHKDAYVDDINRLSKNSISYVFEIGDCEKQ